MARHWTKYPIPENPPAGFFTDPDRIPRKDVWERLALAVQVIAETHYSTFQDIRNLLAEDSGLDPKVYHQLISKYLPRYGLAITDVIPTVNRSRLGLIRLTDKGKDLARALGVKLFDYSGPRVPGFQLGYASDWEDVIEHHQGEYQHQHTGLLLHFDLTVRQLGGETWLLPPVDDEYYKPDIRITFADSHEDPIYVEVEGRHHRGKWDKWRNQARYQDFVALCAKTPAIRQVLVRECRSAGVAGIATDLQTLLKNYHTGKVNPFWQEYWPGRFLDARLTERLSRLTLQSPAL
jgi:hypothetical protein